MSRHENTRGGGGEGCKKQARLLSSKYDGSHHTRIGLFLLEAPVPSS